jgi:hypothetical protein
MNDGVAGCLIVGGIIFGITALGFFIPSMFGCSILMLWPIGIFLCWPFIEAVFRHPWEN